MSDGGCDDLVQKAREAAQVEQPLFQQPSEATVMGGVKANGKGLGWPLIAEAPTEGWPLLVDTCFHFSELARL
jgi:hypothetical protein